MQAPSDIYLFPNPQKRLGGKIFTDENHGSDAVNANFYDFNKLAYQTAITILEHRYGKCIKLNREINYKNKVFLFRSSTYNSTLIRITVM